ncbi:hypothetical protein [Polaromonas sp. JS666]|uniref:hypothetical protein n=1 Tax=Polaromonas sp. (strain JS666 / ATCC BAA-500) TaxID=296591 RepID=UPI0000535481|nr:hypothetical protein [Polaromonas sp. JS666]ABE43124.1 conserved hypothetical protein [Polaromonas sp. JS666]
MSSLHQTVLGIALAAAAMGSWAQTAAEHAQHHPIVVAAGQPPAGQAGPAPGPASADRMAAMDRQMKVMREMREKMANAKTPEERNALMAEHMKTMQDGMAMMNMMGGPGMGPMGGMQGGKPMTGTMNERQQMMEKRMDMMQSMMQMMMDRQPPPATK